MSLSRRGTFGLFLGAPVAAATVAKAVTAPEPEARSEFFDGQIREVVSHYEAHPRSFYGSHQHSFAVRSLDLEAVPVLRQERWNGTEWLPIAPTPTDTGGR